MTVTTTTAAIELLRGAGLRVDTDDAALRAVATDRSGLVATGLPAARVLPRTVAEVQEVLRTATATGTPVVPRGAGSGLAGGATASAGVLVLDLSALDRIVEIRPQDRRAVVEAGVVTADLDRAARAHGLRYTPDPASVELSTIGGNIATNAGGLRCAKYGVTGDAVVGLDVVLADGTLVHTGGDVAKSVAGYDLTSLFVGSEGTLGVVVRATVRLDALPRATETAGVVFQDLAAAARACAALAGGDVRTSMLELLDARTLAAIDRLTGTDLRQRGEAFVLVQTDGLGATAEMAALEQVLLAHGGQVERAASDEDAERLVEVRRQALPAVEAFGRAFIEDVAVPVHRLAEAADAIAALSEATGVPIFVFAHAGDGNLHPIVVDTSAPGSSGSSEAPGSDGPVPEAVTRVVDELFALAIRLGGTITAEHGVGVLKRAWLARQVGPETLRLHTTVKRALDPAGILNPGKAY